MTFKQKENKMQGKIELKDTEVKQILIDYIKKELGNVEFKASDLIIEVKSDQNYKSEWEKASIRAHLNFNIY